MSDLQRKPGSRMIRLLFLLGAVALCGPLFGLVDSLVAFQALAIHAWLGLCFIFFVLAAWDFSEISNMPLPRIERELPKNFSQNTWTPVPVLIEHDFSNATPIKLFDHTPMDTETNEIPCEIQLEPGSPSKIIYSIKCTERGIAHFDKLEIAQLSKLGLWNVARRCGEPADVRVFPNFAAVAHYIHLATEQHTYKLGIRQRPRRGEGLEFQQLREYRMGDTLRQIDWKTTARKQKLISKEYQEERDQHVFLLLDCGRHMRARDHGLNHFDHALNSTLLLSYVALREGDSVGMMSFGAETRWLPSSKGVQTFSHLVNRVYDLQSSTAGSDYSEAAKEFTIKHRRRALVVLLTNLRNENLDDLSSAVKLLRQRHIVLLANLRENWLDQTLTAPVQDRSDAMSYLGTQQFLQQRKHTMQRLRNLGVITFDTTPQELPAALVNHYYAIKRSGAL